MAKDTEFSLEELDRMYDEAMQWEPPTQTPATPVSDSRSTLNKLIASRKGENNDSLRV